MFYDNFVELCEKKGVSRTKACVDCNVSRTAWRKWEGGGTPNGTTLNAFAEYFGVTTDYLLTGEEKEKSPSKIGEGRHHIPDEETLKLLELLETREDIRYLAAASQRATPEHVKATAKMFDELYGRKQDE